MTPTAEMIDMETVVKSIPKVVQSQLKEHCNDILVAGGFLRDGLLGISPTDLDVFCKTETLAEELASYKNGGLGVVKTDNAFTVNVQNVKTQYIYCRPFTDAYSLINEFDFTVCGIAVNWDLVDFWRVTTVDHFHNDLQTKTLRFRCADYNRGNLGALNRAFKFVARGWSISNEEIAKIIHHYDETKSLETVTAAVTPTYRRNRGGLQVVENVAVDPTPLPLDTWSPRPTLDELTAENTASCPTAYPSYSGAFTAPLITINHLTRISIPGAVTICGDDLENTPGYRDRVGDFPAGTVLGYANGLSIEIAPERRTIQDFL